MWDYLNAIDESTYLRHRQRMGEALLLARSAGEAGDVPVGAIITDKNGEIIARAANRKERDRDPTAHAEILALQMASRVLGDWHLNDCTLYVTLEPCPMCAGAILQARLGLLIYGADDPKTGVIRTVANFADSVFSNHRLPTIAGVLETEARELLRTWFENKRA
ncbi:nucleoside deaminase [Pannus brasiliensis CCIBt3594]|uniref:tRNA-specific adenosine deaminase n=1 Tax=Pannus brasiliensis CCIBt3594 TaxID=1427578 RepID=A0AAW9QSD3_9CHRO